MQLVREHMSDPLRWSKPRLIFVNSMSDMFHEKLSNEEIGAVFGIMAAAPQHTFQILTKRAKRMHAWFEWLASGGGASQSVRVALMARRYIEDSNKRLSDRVNGCDEKGRLVSWPLKNVWLGVSAEDQPNADERIPELLRTPAAVRFVSYEPALGLIQFREEWLRGAFLHCGDETDDEATDPCKGCPGWTGHGGDHCGAVRGPKLDWIIVGGESGHGARPFDVGWARSVVAQCKEAGVACFVKQLGAHVRTDGVQSPGEWWPKQDTMIDDGLGGFRKHLDDRKGGDMSEWSPDLRVREFPKSMTR